MKDEKNRFFCDVWYRREIDLIVKMSYFIFNHFEILVSHCEIHQWYSLSRRGFCLYENVWNKHNCINFNSHAGSNAINPPRTFIIIILFILFSSLA